MDGLTSDSRSKKWALDGFQGTLALLHNHIHCQPNRLDRLKPIGTAGTRTRAHTHLIWAKLIVQGNTKERLTASLCGGNHLAARKFNNASQIAAIQMDAAAHFVCLLTCLFPSLSFYFIFFCLYLLFDLIVSLCK